MFSNCSSVFMYLVFICCSNVPFQPYFTTCKVLRYAVDKSLEYSYMVLLNLFQFPQFRRLLLTPTGLLYCVFILRMRRVNHFIKGRYYYCFLKH